LVWFGLVLVRSNPVVTEVLCSRTAPPRSLRRHHPLPPSSRVLRHSWRRRGSLLRHQPATASQRLRCSLPPLRRLGFASSSAPRLAGWSAKIRCRLSTRIVTAFNPRADPALESSPRRHTDRQRRRDRAAGGAGLPLCNQTGGAEGRGGAFQIGRVRAKGAAGRTEQGDVISDEARQGRSCGPSSRGLARPSSRLGKGCPLVLTSAHLSTLRSSPSCRRLAHS
jgi:hypothetical protein